MALRKSPARMLALTGVVWRLLAFMFRSLWCSPWFAPNLRYAEVRLH